MTTASARGPWQWTVAVPIVSVVLLAATWAYHEHVVALVAIAAALVGSVLAAVHHAEVVAHRVGEPYGSLILAVAVTVIEVGLIIMLMSSGGDGASTYARDTVFAAVMITFNGIVGLSMLVGAAKHHLVSFNASGAGSALGTVVALATVTLILPSYTSSAPGGEYTPFQLGFAAVASLVLYGAFVFTQTVRHRSFFLPVTSDQYGRATGILDEEDGDHAALPSDRDTLLSLALLVASLVAVVGLAKLLSPTIEHAVEAAGLPYTVVGVVIALLVLAPESIAAVRNAASDRMQTSLNLAYGSAMASIGLTIPVIAVAMVWLPGELWLGLNETQVVLFAVSVVVAILSVVQGHAKTLQGVVHLVLLAAFVVVSVQP
ncbi:ionic transporter y4hA [Myceligenerans cantabricum]